MPNYEYRARDKFGKPTSGILEASSERAAGSKLKQMGYTPISIRSEVEESELLKFFRRFQKVRYTDLNIFTRQFVTLQKAGLPLLNSLTSLKDQTTSSVLKNALEVIIKDIEAGSSLSDALAKHPNVFSELYISMVRAGEISGLLDEVLERLALLGEQEEETKVRIRVATRYPIMVVCALAVGFLVLTTFVIPRFAKVFSQFEVQLPLPTRVLIGLNYAFTNFWILILAGLGLFIFGFYLFIRTSLGRFWLDSLKLKIPVFGPLFTKITMSRFARITGMLIKSGVPILEILDLVAKGVGNVVIARTITSIRSSVNEGEGMSEPMKASAVFPPAVVQMVAAGEATGKIDELLFYVSEYYDSQINYTIKNLTSLIEPILIFILGVAVLFVALGIFLPMWNLIKLFR